MNKKESDLWSAGNEIDSWSLNDDNLIVLRDTGRDSLSLYIAKGSYGKFAVFSRLDVEQLVEKEKGSDRDEANKIIKIITNET